MTADDWSELPLPEPPPGLAEAVERATEMYSVLAPAFAVFEQASAAAIAQADDLMQTLQGIQDEMTALSAEQASRVQETLHHAAKFWETVDPFEPLRQLRESEPSAESAVLDALPDPAGGPATAEDFARLTQAAKADLRSWFRSRQAAQIMAALFVFLTWWWLAIVAGRFDLAEKIDQSLLVLLAYLVGKAGERRD